MMIQKYKIKIILLIGFIVSMGLLIISVENVEAKTSPVIVLASQKIKINKSFLSLYCGNQYQLRLYNTKSKIKWSSRNKSIATVNSKGVVTAKKAGTTYIYATVGKTRKSCKIIVKNRPFTLQKTSITMYKGKTTTLKTFNAKGKVTWSSSNKSIATVSSKGVITAKKAGTVSIYARNGKTTKKCKVTIRNPYTISLSYSNMQLVIGESKTNKVTMKPYYKDEKISYSSSNTQVATVNSSGKVTGKKAGTATITVKTSLQTKSYKVTVYKNVTKDSISFVAHRGYHKSSLENTMDAFQNAMNKGYYGIETDVRITKDGQFVLSHDDSLSRVFGVEMKVSESSLEELKDITHDGITTLEEFLAFMEDKKEIPYIELKSMISSDYPDLEDNIERFMDILAQYHYSSSGENTLPCYIISFYQDYIDAVRAKDKNIQIDLISSSKTIDIDYLLENNYGLDWRLSCASSSTVKNLINKGISVDLWVVNNKYDAATVIDWGIRTITTDECYF